MLTYSQRAEHAINPMGQRLLQLMDEKQTNLGLAADVTSSSDLLDLANTLGPEICILKTHIDILEDFTFELTFKLTELAEKHHFLIFEDRKFADIGTTVVSQYRKGIYRISDWAHITNAHTVPGPGIIEGLKQVGLPKKRGLLLLAEMSPKGTLAKGAYTQRSVEMAEEHADFVMGFIALRKLSENPGLISMTPGVKLTPACDALGQNYLTPEQVVGKQKSDVILVGRGVCNAADPLLEAKRYREAGWLAYKNRV